jgi:hypothetical protein
LSENKKFFTLWKNEIKIHSERNEQLYNK